MPPPVLPYLGGWLLCCPPTDPIECLGGGLGREDDVESEVWGTGAGAASGEASPSLRQTTCNFQ